MLWVRMLDSLEAKASGRDGLRIQPILVARQPVDWFLHSIQVEDCRYRWRTRPGCRQQCRGGTRRLRLESGRSHRFLPSAESAFSTRFAAAGWHAPSRDFARSGARRGRTCFSSVPARRRHFLLLALVLATASLPFVSARWIQPRPRQALEHRHERGLCPGIGRAELGKPGGGPPCCSCMMAFLIAQLFDARRMGLSGERTVVVPEVRYQRWHQARFSVSENGVLLYQGDSAGNHQLAWFNRQGQLLAEVGPRNDYLSLRLSPDERHVVVNRPDGPDTVFPTIWVMDLLREGVVFRFTDTGGAEAEFTLAWSPDSREILFSRGDDRGMRLLRQAERTVDPRRSLWTPKARNSRRTGLPTGRYVERSGS